MNKKLFTVVCGALLAAFGLDSCDTPTGQGAAAGAGAGAIIGGLATGRARGAALGPGPGAGGGAVKRQARQGDPRRRQRPPPPGGYPVGDSSGGTGSART